MFFKIGALKSVVIFTGKRLCWNLVFNKAADLRYVSLLKKRLQQKCLPVSIAELLRTPYFTKNLWWLLL